MKNEKKILEHLYKLRNYILTSRYRDINVIIEKSKKIKSIENINYTYLENKSLNKEITECFKFILINNLTNKEVYHDSELLDITFNDIDATVAYLRE